MNPDQIMFIMTMAPIRACEGDPAHHPGMEQLAEAVLSGRMDPVQAMIATAPPFSQQQLVAAVQMMRMIGMYQLIHLTAVIQAASSLPRERIPVLIPEVRQAG